MGTLTPSASSTITTATTNSTNTNTSSNATPTTASSSISQQPPFHLLEITLISAQDLAPISKSMKSYAVVWVHPDRKLTTRIDGQGHANPTWNDKFIFRVDGTLLSFDSSTAVMIKIY